MHFPPIYLDSVFSEEDLNKLRVLVSSDTFRKKWVDSDRDRSLRQYSELEEYFSSKLEPLAKTVFKDESLKSSYSVYIDYNKPTSELPKHKDNNACTYTIDFCLSAKTPWPIVIEDEEFIITENQALAFMGGHDYHYRPAMPDPETNRVEIIMFHFVPEDHWFFTEGKNYVHELAKAGTLPEGDSYHLSPKLKK